MPASDLLSWQVTNPTNLEDHLPQPYRLINDVLHETILHQLQLAMHHIQEKKKNPTYEGRVHQYVAQSLIQIDHEISCLSSQSKYQNYLLAGDRKGNLLLIDTAKKSLFAKKELTPNKRVNFITETTLSDNQTFITIAAVISNHSPTIKLLRSKHSDPKLFLFAEVHVADNQNDISKLPYECQLEDDGRLLLVKTYDGCIVAFCVPELKIDQEKVKAQQNINEGLSNASSSIKKPIIYPLDNAVMESACVKITQKLFQMPFQGYEKPPKYKDLLNRLKNKSKPAEPQPQQQNKKDSKKQAKKPQVTQMEPVKQAQKELILNQKAQKKQVKIWNNNEITEPYCKPNFEPFCYVLYEDVEFPRKKSFEKSKQLKMAAKLIYGWTHTKDVYSVNLLTETAPKYEHTPYYVQFLHSQTLIAPDHIAKLQQQYKKAFNTTLIHQKQSHLCNKTVYPITATAVSPPESSHLAVGLEDGTTSIYLTQNLTLQQNSDKHTAPVTQLRFFQHSWKLISGSQNGQIFITNLIQQKPELKTTQIFQAKQPLSIVDIKLNQEVGLAFVIDAGGNVRVYDLWRNAKISRFMPSNSFAISQGKGKKWMNFMGLNSASTIYTNKDYSVLLSIDWPNIPTSKTAEIPPQLLTKAAQLKANPWKSPQINLHVIRNFQFLLQHFDGLQSVYKKGHEKSKVLNLFTNLEFAQLYDRNFDIPDFGRTVNINGPSNNGSNLKSNLTQYSKFNTSKMSLKKSPSKNKTVSGKSTGKDTPLGQTRNVKLTTEVLHPEKFLFQRRKVFDPVKELPTTNEKLIQKLREQHKKKQRRANILQEELNRTSGGI